MIIIIITTLLPLINSATYTYLPCPTTSIRNVTTLECITCPNGTQPDPSSINPLKCTCKAGYQQSNNGACTQYATSCNSTSIYSVLDIYGTYSNSNISCIACDAAAYPNICIPCATGMKYQLGSGCICVNANFTKTLLGCFDPSITTSLITTTSVYSQKLKYLIAGCNYFNDYLSCSQLLNLCSYSLGGDTPQCNYFTTFNKSSLLFATETFTLSSFTKGQKFNFKLISFLSTGNYIAEKTMLLVDVFRCGLPSDASLGIVIGNNIKIECVFNFNNLLEKMSGNNYRSSTYQLFVEGDNAVMHEVSVFYDGNAKAYKRFFLEDTTTDPTKVKIANKVQFKFTLSSNGQLSNPSVYLSYKTLSIESGVGVVPTSQKLQTVKLSVTFVYALTTFWSTIIGIFVAVNVLILLHSVFRTYVGYLNRKSGLQFFTNYMRIWSLWIFYFLVCVSGYWFLFTKTTSSVFLLVPDDSRFYSVFYAIAAIMGIFRILTVLIDKINKVNTEVFLVNWEKGSVHRNSWREIFIVNSLAQFYTYRTVSMLWMMLWVLLFLVGLKWQSYATQTITTDLTNSYTFHPKNRVLLYFLGASIFLMVGIVFKTLRRISVMFWPYPFENFVDYCSVTNISFFFMRKRSPEAYYIHASIPNRTQVGLKDLNLAIQRGLQKNRSITKQFTHQDHLRLYTIYASQSLENSFNLMLEKTQDDQQVSNGRNPQYKKIKKQNYRQKFIQQKLKPKLEEIIRQNTNRTKTMLESLCGFPPISLRDPNSVRRQHALFDQSADLVSEVFPNGNQFEDIHTFIIIFLLWNLILNNSAIAALLTYIVEQFLINNYISNKSKNNLERMTGVRQGFMM